MRLNTVAAEEAHTSYRAPTVPQAKPREVYEERIAKHQVPAPQLLLELALQGYKSEHLGKFPAALAELVTANYLKALPTDLYAHDPSSPFHYDPAIGKLWSVGANGLDEHSAGDDSLKEFPWG